MFNLGKGLEALIPKKKDEIGVSFSKDATVLSRREKGEASLKSRQAGGTISSFVMRQDTEASVIDAQASKSSNEQSGLRKEKFYPRSESIFHIEVEKIKPNPYQPRRDFNDEDLKDLAQSIREFGILQPLVVSKLVKETNEGTEVEYQLIAGERRLLASKLLGLRSVPAIITTVPDHKAKLEMALIENIQRSDLNPIEEACAYSRLQAEFGLTQREIAARVGKSREVIANKMRLLNLSSEIQDALCEGKISESEARVLLSISNPNERQKALAAYVLSRFGGRDLEEKNVGERKRAEADPDKIYWERRLEEALGAPVRLYRRGDKGKMIIRFYSTDEWRNILGKILGEGQE